MVFQHFIPPPNYGMVEDNVYRSGQPNELNFPFLEKLELKTLIYLGSEEPNDQFLNFIEDQDIQLYHFGSSSQMGAQREFISEEIVLDALSILLNPAKHSPILIACNFGRHHTGTVVGCLRKLQHWNLTSIFEEYRRFAGTKVRVMNEQFIELFDTDLVRIPIEPPEWL